MKWSQGLCAAILLDGIYAFSPAARSNQRMDRDLPRSPVDPAFTPNALAADWGLPPGAGRTDTPKAGGVESVVRQPRGPALEL